jgi:crotonobetaine/carnitine-CoA ligase
VITRETLLPQRIEALARRAPDRLAIQNVDGRKATWGLVHESALVWAAAYRNAGVAPDDTVATLLPNTFESFFAWLGISWLGAVEVPVNTLYRGSMLTYVIENSEVEVLVTSTHFLDQLAAVQNDLTRLKTVLVIDAEADDVASAGLDISVVRGRDFLDAAAADDLRGPDPWDVAAMVYTSGTTGPSKGVLVPWGELFEWLEFVPDDLIGPGEPYYSTFPTFHISGKTSLYTAAHNDAYLLIRESFSVNEFWNDVRTFGVQAVGLAGPMAAMLMVAPATANDADNPLRSVILGPVIPNIEEFRARFAVERFATGYGTTEVGFPIVSPWNPPNPRTCGRLRADSPYYEVRIVDERDNPVAPGTVGELIVRTGEPWTMNLGYRGMPDVTAAAWRNGWFHTGDAFTQDEQGWFYLADRIKDTVRRRGENISSVEVEQGILGHPAVGECAVIAVPSELGEDDVKAVIVLKPGASLAPEELIDYLKPRMANFMIPRYIEFVGTLPRTEGTFRVRKVALRADPFNAATWDRTHLNRTVAAGNKS